MAVTVFAAIDIGSYEVSMKIFEFSRKIGFRDLNDVRYRLEIGKGVYSNRRLDPEIVDAICTILKDFRRIMEEFGVEDYRACATSAFREMVNPVIIQEQIFQRTGIRVEILSNAEQHFLGYKSIAAKEAGFKKMIQKGTAILDIGGGSLQVSLFDKDALVSTQSLKMGSMRIRERLRELEKTNTHYDQLIEEFIRNDLMAFQRLYLKDQEIRNVILMGDFLSDTIFRGERNEHIITMEEFSNLYENIVYKTEQTLASEMDIDPEFASLVVPTMVICRSFLEIFQAEAVWVPGVSLLDGIAYDFEIRIAQASAIDAVTESAIYYDAQAQLLVAPSTSEVTVYNQAGQLVLDAQGTEISVASLAQGVYIAKVGNQVIKFVK